MKYYWVIITLLFAVKILQGKQLSSYNTKWMFVYVVYVLWLQAEEFYEEEEWLYIWSFFLLPLVAYLMFPFIWKYIGKWKLFKVIDNFVDKWYKTIKELNQ